MLPWLVDAIWPGRLPATVFVLWVATPLAVFNTAAEAVGVELAAEGHSQFSLLLLVWLVGEMAARARQGPFVFAVLSTVAVVGGRAILDPSFAHASLYWTGGAAMAFLAGFLFRRQQQALSELRTTHIALAEVAARRERQRIARELQDVVAHTLTVTLMHIGVARRSIDRDPAATRGALHDAAQLGGQSLADFRRTVGLLHTEDEGSDAHRPRSSPRRWPGQDIGRELPGP